MNIQGQDTEDMQDFHPVETDHYEDLEHNNPSRVMTISYASEFSLRKGNPQKP